MDAIPTHTRSTAKICWELEKPGNCGAEVAQVQAIVCCEQEAYGHILTQHLRQKEKYVHVQRLEDKGQIESGP